MTAVFTNSKVTFDVGSFVVTILGTDMTRVWYELKREGDQNYYVVYVARKSADTFQLDLRSGIENQKGWTNDLFGAKQCVDDISAIAGECCNPFDGLTIQGPQGPQGGQGVQGPQGLDGAFAAQGIQGTTGLQGVQGFRGTQGFTGLGVQGVQGTQGPSGSTGSAGSQGTQGVQGTIGIQGTQGVQGEQGVQGIQGTQGIQGNNGAQGIQGITGTSGSSSSIFDYKARTTTQTPPPTSGYIIWDNATQINSTNIYVSHLTDGSVTLDIDVILSIIKVNDYLYIQDKINSSDFQKWQVSGTPTNTPGSYWTFPVTLVSSGGAGTTNFANNNNCLLIIQSVGVQGTTGSQGLQGIQGPQGTDGLIGPTGSQGTQGLQGLTGATGATGAQGTQGLQGLDGLTGATGTQGTQGLQGTTGITGPTGLQGTQGIQGTSGAVYTSTDLNYTGGNQATTSTSVANVHTSAAFTGIASGRYTFEFAITYNAATTATGSLFVLQGANGTYLTYTTNYQTAAADGSSTAIIGLNPAAIATASSRATTGNYAIVQGNFYSNNSGSLTLQFATEVAGSAITVTAVVGWIRQYQ